MNESDAKAALRAQGVRYPSKTLVENYIRAQEYEEAQEQAPEAAQEPAEQKHPHPSSASNLEPVLRERGELVRPAGGRKPGRPRVLVPWFQAVATAMADGTPLRTALKLCGIHGLTERQIRALYRNRALKAVRDEARRKWLAEWGVRTSHRRRTVRPKGASSLGPDSIGQSWAFRRTL